MNLILATRLTTQGYNMSLEEALNRNSDLLETHNGLLEKMLASAGNKTATKAAEKPAAEKPAAKPAAKKPAAKPAAKKTAAKKTTVDDIAKAFGSYLKTGDSEAREAAKVNVKAIVDYFGAAKATAIPEADWAEALGYLAQFEAGEEVEFDGGEEAEDEDEALV